MNKSIYPLNRTKPTFRKLQGYAFDPSLSLQIETANINALTYKVSWEDLKPDAEPDSVDHGPGPIGEYVEVIDFDPTVKRFYEPVDLNNPNLLAQEGLPPSESNPQFHQQMVYAVIMTTIKNFEKALGRPVLWSSYMTSKKIPASGSPTGIRDMIVDNYIGRLRVYPHAFRDANAYYSPQKKALLFGYFSSQPAEITLQMPNSLVFTCLSHDIIAHETTHAILDGMYRKYTEDTNPDMLAFHEAFADIVALFQHFTFPEVLKNQIAKTRGDLASQNLLGELAQQFGTAIGNYGALRDALGSYDQNTKEWKPLKPNGDEYRTVLEPHARGAILVAAVFEAFITIYKNRVSDLLRLSTGGSGILPQGELHPDLVNRLANEASKTAGHVLKMCIRALDYCPPIDINFGDYLRAIITADVDLVNDDDNHYRIAFIDAFRKRGIYPTGIKNLSVESLCYSLYDNNTLDSLFNILITFLKDFRGAIMYTKNRKEIFEITTRYIKGDYESDPKILGLQRRIDVKFDNVIEFEKITGLCFSNQWRDYGIPTSYAYNSEGPSFATHTLHLASRTGPDGIQSNQIIISLVQRAGVQISIHDNGDQEINTFDPDIPGAKLEKGFTMWGGCTLIFDLDSMKLKYAINKPLLDPDALDKDIHKICPERSKHLNSYFNGDGGQVSLYAAYFSMGRQFKCNEPFSFLHTH